jgi:hypothetical protein
MHEKGIDVYLVQETWLSSDYEDRSVINGCYVFHHGTNKEASDSNDDGDEENPQNQNRKGRSRGGVAIFLSPKATAAWKRAGQLDPIISGNILGCARYIALTLHFLDHLGELIKINACSIYHPTGVSQQQRCEFLNEIDTLYDKLDERDHIIISGCDANASLGSRTSTFCNANGTSDDQSDNEDNIGPFGLDYLNEAGVDLTHLLKAKNMVAASTFFNHKNNCTWRSFRQSNTEKRQQLSEEQRHSNDHIETTEARVRYQLDHFFTQKRFLSRIIDCRRAGDGAPSDHSAIRLTLRTASKLSRIKSKFNIRGSKKSKKRKRVPINWKLLRVEEMRLQFNNELRQIISKEKADNGNIPISYASFIKATMRAAEETIQGEGRISKSWFEISKVELNRAIGLKNYWSNIWMLTDLEGARAKHSEARRNLKNAVKEAKRKWQNKRAEEIHNMKFDPKSAWAAVRELEAGLDGHHSKQSDMKMKMEDGSFAVSDKDNADIMGSHFKKVFNNHKPIDLSVLEELEQKPILDELGFTPTEGEIRAALRKIANGKSPGESGITPEALKGLDGYNFSILADFLTAYWNDPMIDYEDWHRNLLCALQKPGKGKDYSSPDSWRGICLAEIPAKIQSSIISTRLLNHLEKVGIETQYGCVPGKGCADALFSIKTALQTRKQHGKDTWAAFIDLVKAFDTADHELLFLILKKYGVPETLVSVIAKMYKDAVVILKVGEESREVPYKVGVKQGDNMAPVLFIYLMNAFAETLAKKRKQKWQTYRPKSKSERNSI